MIAKESCTLLLFEVLREFAMERINLNVVGGDGENGLPEKMTCMEDSKWVAGIAVRAVAVYIYGSGCLILVKWRWNTLTQRFLQVVRNTKKALYLGVKLQVRQQKKRTRRTEEKRPCAPFTLRFGRVVEAEVVASGMQAGRLVSSMGSTSRLKGRNMVGGRRLLTGAPGG